jgi:hypothetical protein
MSGSLKKRLTGASNDATVTRARLQGRLFGIIGSALAMVTFASPILSTLHDTAVPHVACPDDGELIEVPRLGPHAHTQAPDDARAFFPERPLPAGSSDHSHGHCAIAVRVHQRAHEQSSRASIVLTQAAAHLLERPDDALRPRGPALYLLAPKASPPLC